LFPKSSRVEPTVLLPKREIMQFSQNLSFSEQVSWLALLQAERAIAVIRVPEMELGLQLARAVATGGLRLIEITWNSDRPAHLISKLRQELPACAIGAGTLLEPGQVREAIAAGAEFLFSPYTNPELIQLAADHQVPMVAGALTPTEIVTAWQAGSSGVKVFPIQAVGGARYLSSLRDPLGGIPLIPTGGVTLENAAEFLAAGAIAVGLSSQLFPKEAIATGTWSQVTDRTKALVQALKPYRQIA